MEKEVEPRAAIFIDGSNLYHILKGMFPDKRMNDFNFESFVNFLSGDRQLVKTCYYNSPLDRRKDEDAYMRQQRFFDKIKRIPNFNFIMCRMQKRKVDGKVIYEVKEDDIHLAVDMVKMACDDKYDVAILVSSDGDFVPAVDAVKDTKKIVENIGFENKFSYHLQQRANKFIKLRKEDLVRMFENPCA